MEHVADMEKMKYAYNILVRKPVGKNYMRGQGVYRSIILNWTLKT
jgi:hypothetical protein